jgi:hypothetical protein
MAPRLRPDLRSTEFQSRYRFVVLNPKMGTCRGLELAIHVRGTAVDCRPGPSATSIL